jgi:ureidoglycolate hydrolase
MRFSLYGQVIRILQEREKSIDDGKKRPYLQVGVNNALCVENYL